MVVSTAGTSGADNGASQAKPRYRNVSRLHRHGLPIPEGITRLGRQN